MELDVTYTFDLTPQTHPDYMITRHIAEWLHDNMENLSDGKDTVFSKVNYGYNEQTLKGFGKKPVCDVYIDSLEYGDDLTHNRPEKVTSFIIAYLKGNSNDTFLKACELTDYMLQEFEENQEWRELIIPRLENNETLYNRIVKHTRVTDCQLKIIPQGKSYGVLCAFELSHELY